jgi:DNA-binding response OmpR family regulator
MEPATGRKEPATSLVQDVGMSASATRVLVVDDEPMVREVLARYLEKEGFQVQTAEDGERALAAFEAAAPDLVLLDLMLPRVDGLEVFRRMRERSPTAVIMLTAKGEETDRVVGLELGADDYITKPFSPREVVARVRAVLRRSAGAVVPRPDVIEFDGVRVDGPRREVHRDEEPIHLTRKEFDLLWLLTSNPSRTFSRSELLEDVWDFAWTGDASTVTVHVRRLREKIERDPSNPAHLLTVWGVGYRFEP